MFETPIGARGSADWEREAAHAPATLARPGYTAPRTMLWDGVHSQPDALSTGDVLCFVLRAYKAPTAQEADVASLVTAAPEAARSSLVIATPLTAYAEA